MIALLTLTLTLAAAPAASGTIAAAPRRPAVSADTLEWDGFAVLEPLVLGQIAERWQVSEEDVSLEWGEVHTDWIPGPGVEVELSGTGRGGFWIVSADEGPESIAFQVRASSRRTVVVAARTLARGSVLEESDIAVETRNEWGAPPGELAAVEAGWLVRRVMKAGEVLEPPAVTPPNAVTSGAPVTIEWVNGSVAVTLPGTALGTVPVGRDVYVRTESGERLRGRAVGPGRVRIS